ncbi:hypothetical protein AAF712_009353 [Marasmius tenuissimus]|uniref:Uncharacterized protein n=1 Tax=Marasmius tenuissimus TaxID=585030 RepID=A0ABR2ZRF0_9AGAR|nr:hypothetical protein PM082_016083 [Marasmius tenuissimus]
MTSYSVQVGLNGQFPPQSSERDQRDQRYEPYTPQHYPNQHSSYFPPPYPTHSSPFPGAPQHYPDQAGPLRPAHRAPPKPSSLKQKLFNLAVGQEVEVCVRSNVFVVGLVVSVLTFFDKIAGFGYEIRYRTLGGGESTDVFGVDRIRPR